MSVLVRFRARPAVPSIFELVVISYAQLQRQLGRDIQTSVCAVLASADNVGYSSLAGCDDERGRIQE